MGKREDCDHPEVQFGSDGFYIFCHDCGAR